MDGKEPGGGKKRQRSVKKSPLSKYPRKDGGSENEVCLGRVVQEDREEVRRRELNLLTREELVEKIIRLEEIRDEISKLPDELLLYIFAFLPKLTLGRTARVCKRWQRISYDKEFWGYACYVSKEVVSSGELGEVLARGCLHLVLYDCKFKQPVFTMREIESSYQLKKLCMCGCEMSMVDFHTLLSRCTNLVELYSNESLVDDEICHKISKNPNLNEIILDMDAGEFTHEGLLTIARGCKQLVKFRIFAYDAKVHHTSHNDLMTLVEELPSTLECLKIFPKHTNFSDHHLQVLVSRLPDLQELHLEGCTKLTGKAIKYILRLEKLTFLNIATCENIPVVALKELCLLPLLSVLEVYDLVTGDEYAVLQELMPDVLIEC